MNRIYITIPLLSCLLMCACHRIESDIRPVAQAYLDATCTYDFDAAVQNCTPETAQGLRDVEEYIMPRLDSAIIAHNSQSTVEVQRIDVHNDTSATVTYHKTMIDKEYTDTLHMVNRDGRWMAHVKILVPKLAKEPQTVHYNYDSIAPGSLKVKQ